LRRIRLPKRTIRASQLGSVSRVSEGPALRRPPSGLVWQKRQGSSIARTASATICKLQPRYCLVFLEQWIVTGGISDRSRICTMKSLSRCWLARGTLAQPFSCHTGPPVIRPLSAQIFVFQKRWTQTPCIHTALAPLPTLRHSSGMKDTDSAHIPLLQAA
jgi:hypothetical protein